jgi:hypothetical protein
VIGDWRPSRLELPDQVVQRRFSPVTDHQSAIANQYPFGRASVSIKLPLRGESFHTWNPVSK